MMKTKCFAISVLLVAIGCDGAPTGETGGRLYFRTDDESRAEYQNRGMTAYQPKARPRGPKTVDRNFTVPQDVMADTEQLREWALRAVKAARKK